MNLTLPTWTKLLTHLHKREREKSVRKLNLESLPLQGKKNACRNLPLSLPKISTKYLSAQNTDVLM